jgi:hypothetical protein
MSSTGVKAQPGSEAVAELGGECEAHAQAPTMNDFFFDTPVKDTA